MGLEGSAGRGEESVVGTGWRGVGGGGGGCGKSPALSVFNDT